MANLPEPVDVVCNSFPLTFCMVYSHFGLLHNAIKDVPYSAIKQCDTDIAQLKLKLKHRQMELRCYNICSSSNELTCLQMLDDAIKRERTDFEANTKWVHEKVSIQHDIKHKMSNMKHKLDRKLAECKVMDKSEQMASEIQKQLNQLNIDDTNANNIIALIKFKDIWPNDHSFLWHLDGLSFLIEFNGIVRCLTDMIQTTHDRIINKNADNVDDILHEIEDNKECYNEFASLLNNANPSDDKCSCLNIMDKNKIPGSLDENHNCGKFMLNTLLTLQKEVVDPLKLGRLNTIQLEFKNAWDALSIIQTTIASLRNNHILQSMTDVPKLINSNIPISHNTNTNHQPQQPKISNVKRSHDEMNDYGDNDNIVHHSVPFQLHMNPSIKPRTK